MQLKADRPLYIDSGCKIWGRGIVQLDFGILGLAGDEMNVVCIDGRYVWVLDPNLLQEGLSLGG